MPMTSAMNQNWIWPGPFSTSVVQPPRNRVTASSSLVRMIERSGASIDPWRLAGPVSPQPSPDRPHGLGSRPAAGPPGTPPLGHGAAGSKGDSPRISAAGRENRVTVDNPRDIAGAFAEAWMARDADALARLFAEDADFVNVVGIWWEDRRAIRAAHHYGLTTFFRDSRLVVGRTKLRRIGEDAAVVHARMSLTGQRAPDRSEAGRRTTILAFVMARQQDGGWLCFAAQNTDVVPGRETFERTGDDLIARDYR